MAWARRLPSGRWQGQYRDPSGKVRAVGGTYAYKADAIAAAEEQQGRKKRGTWNDPTKAKIRFADWSEHYFEIAIDRRNSTMVRDESYLRVHLLPAFGELPLGAIEPIHVQRLVGELAKRRAPATVAIAYRMLARIMAAAVESGYLAQSPCRGVKLPHVEKSEMRFLTATELEHLAGAVPERYRALVLTTGYVGLRWGEVAGLQRQRLNLLRGTLTVAEILTEVRGHVGFGEPKTSASRRSLALPGFLVTELQRHLEAHATHPELVFAGRDGGALRRNNFRRRTWLPAVETAGLVHLRFHDLRHTAAGPKVASNVHPKVMQTRLGHSSISVTLDTYGHLLPSLDQEVADSLEAIHLAALGS